MTNRLFGKLRSKRSDAPRLAVTTPLPEMVAALNAYQPDALITYPSAKAGGLRLRWRPCFKCNSIPSS